MDILKLSTDILQSFSKQFFLTDTYDTEEEYHIKKLIEETNNLHKEVEWLKKTLIEGKYANKFDEVKEKVLHDIEKEVSESALIKAKEEIENSESISEIIITKKINELVQNKINDFDMTKYIDDIRKQHAISEKVKKEKELNVFIEKQLRSGGFLRTVLINLFIIANISIILFLFTQSESGIGKDVLLFISGLYISLSLFIVYIYRSSNLRAKALMALKEDSKRFYDVIYYLDTFANNANLKDNHETIITSMLSNRLENEVTASHPYEKFIDKIIDKIPNK